MRKPRWIAGLTLGGGFGRMSRKFGLTVDSLVLATVVTAEGDEVTASETENPEHLEEASSRPPAVADGPPSFSSLVKKKPREPAVPPVVWDPTRRIFTDPKLAQELR